MRILPSGMIAEKNKLLGGLAWCWLIELDPYDTGERLYIAFNKSDVVANGHTYTAYSGELGGFEENDENDLDSTSIRLWNSPQLTKMFVDHNAFLDREGQILLWLEGETTAPVWLDFVITDATMTKRAIQFTASPPRIFESKFPTRSTIPTCQATYRDPNT